MFDVTTDSFQTEVIDRSMSVPVVVDLWAAWCEPCKQLSPILEKLVVEYGGKWILAKVDVDVEQQITEAFQVQSVPTVYALIKGQPIPLFQGAYPEGQIRPLLDELLRVAASEGVDGGSESAQDQGPDVSRSRISGGSLGYGSTGKKEPSTPANDSVPRANRLGYGTGKPEPADG